MAIFSSTSSNNLEMLKVSLTRSDDVERGMRIELAWPAWKGRVRRACTVHLVIWLRLWLTPGDRHSPYLMAR